MRLLLARALLVVAVLTGLGAMHVVGSPAAGAAAAHAAMPMTAVPMAAAPASAHTAHHAAGHPTGRAADLASAAADGSRAGGHGTGGHGLVADCLLFAATGATLLGALLAAAAARRWLVLRGAPGTSSPASRWTPVHRRPPPAARPLIALCVIRT